MIPSLPTEFWSKIRVHAETAYPSECCGLILGRDSVATRVWACTNAQLKYHQLDPMNFPRTDRNAYFIEPGELLAVEKELRDTGEKIMAIYHSHPDAEAYFSAEDQARALAEGEPIRPEASYLVLSVRQSRTVSHKWFAWNGERYAEEPSDRSD